MASFREINYAVRPAKSVERKMMVEAFRRIEIGWPLSTYRYIGMGSVYFADFQLVHQALGIHDMVSIEREVQYETRFEFNRPFRCVDIKFGESSDVLDALVWDKKAIVWLDYDGKLESSVIADLQTVVQKAVSGTVIAISVNIEPDRPPFEITEAKDKDQWRLDEFGSRIGEDFVPSGLTGDRLRGKSFGLICWQVLNNALREQLVKRNGRPDVREDTLFSQQIFHFKYSDNATMLTVGWILYSQADIPLFQRCNMSGSFFRNGDDPCFIEAPKLTPKEIRQLNGSLPAGMPVDSSTIRELVRITGIGESDINKFAFVYRYYPQYGEIIL